MAIRVRRIRSARKIKSPVSGPVSQKEANTVTGTIVVHRLIIAASRKDTNIHGIYYYKWTAFYRKEPTYKKNWDLATFCFIKYLKITCKKNKTQIDKIQLKSSRNNEHKINGKFWIYINLCLLFFQLYIWVGLSLSAENCLNTYHL